MTAGLLVHAAEDPLQTRDLTCRLLLVGLEGLLEALVGNGVDHAGHVGEDLGLGAVQVLELVDVELSE